MGPVVCQRGGSAISWVQTRAFARAQLRACVHKPTHLARARLLTKPPPSPLSALLVTAALLSPRARYEDVPSDPHGTARSLHEWAGIGTTVRACLAAGSRPWLEPLTYLTDPLRACARATAAATLNGDTAGCHTRHAQIPPSLEAWINAHTHGGKTGGDTMHFSTVRDSSKMADSWRLSMPPEMQRLVWATCAGRAKPFGYSE